MLVLGYVPGRSCSLKSRVFEKTRLLLVIVWEASEGEEPILHSQFGGTRLVIIRLI